MSINDGSVEIKKNNAAAFLEFYHPKANSLPSGLLEEIRLNIKALSCDEEIKTIVISGKGFKTFCGGASFEELINIKDMVSGERFFRGFADLILEINSSPKIIIAKVRGKVVGGGIGLLAACDYAIAHSDASIKLSELSLGIGPFVIEPVITRKIGIAAFTALTLNYDWRASDWAYKIGLYDELYEDESGFETGLSNLLTKLHNSNPEALMELKKIFRSNTESWHTLLIERARISGKLVLSEHTKKYIESFKSKSQ